VRLEHETILQEFPQHQWQIVDVQFGPWRRKGGLGCDIETPQLTGASRLIAVDRKKACLFPNNRLQFGQSLVGGII
jgi:hypothetical protein